MKKDPLNYFLDEVRECSFHSRSVVLVAHGIIELIVNSLITSHCNNGKRILKDTRSYTHSSKCLILNELGILHDEELGLLDRFRALRNDLVHEVKFEVNNNRIKNIIEKFPIKISYVKPANEEELKGNVVSLCIAVVAQVWGSNMEELNDLFSQ